MADNLILKPTRRGMVGYAAYYFVLYMCFQTFGHFSSLYYGANGCTDTQIGIIKGVGQFCFIFSMIIFGKLADKMRDKNLLSCITLILTAGVLVITPLNKSFTWMLVCAVLYLFFNCNQQLMDAITLDYSKKTGTKFGRYRMFGTLGAAIVSLCIGYIVGEDYDRIFYIAAAVALLSAIIVIMLPRDKSPAAEPEEDVEKGTFKELFTNKAAVTLLLLICVLYLPVSFHSAFSSLRITDVGGNLTMVSYSALISSVCGVPMYFFGDKIRKKLGDNLLMLISCIAYITTYVIYALVENPVVLVVASALSLFSSGFMYCATVKMSEVLGPKLQARGQMSIGIAGWGIAMSIGMLFGGMISDAFGSKFSFLLCAGIMAIPLVAVIIIWILSAKKKKTEEQQ